MGGWAGGWVVLGGVGVGVSPPRPQVGFEQVTPLAAAYTPCSLRLTPPPWTWAELSRGPASHPPWACRHGASDAGLRQPALPAGGGHGSGPRVAAPPPAQPWAPGRAGLPSSTMLPASCSRCLPLSCLAAAAHNPVHTTTLQGAGPPSRAAPARGGSSAGLRGRAAPGSDTRGAWQLRFGW